MCEFKIYNTLSNAKINTCIMIKKYFYKRCKISLIFICILVIVNREFVKVERDTSLHIHIIMHIHMYVNNFISLNTSERLYGGSRTIIRRNDQNNDCCTIHSNLQATIDKSVIRDDRVYWGKRKGVYSITTQLA